MNRRTSRATVALAIAAAASSAHAVDFYWQGGAGLFDTPNYTSVDNSTSPATVTPDVSPGTALTDYDFIGAGGSVTSSSDLTIGHLRLGTNSTAAPNIAGDGSFTNTAGTFNASAGSASGGAADSSIIVGYNASGSLTITGGSVVGSFFGKIGYADADGATGSGTVTINGGTLNIRNRGVQIGDGANGFALPGSLTLTAGNLTIGNGTTGQLAIGVMTTGTFTQTGGATTTGNNVFVGRNSTANSSMTVSGGSLTANGGFTVGDGSATDSSATFSGSMTGTVTSSITVSGGATSARSSLTVTDAASLSVVGSLTIGNNADPNAVLNVGGTAAINIGVAANATTAPSVTAHLFVGRSTATTTFNMTGGTIDAPNLALFGTASAGAVITVNHSAGAINAGTSPTSPNRGFKVGDTNGSNTYNLSGTGAVNVAAGPLIVGRQNSTATLNQTGGTVTASGGLHIGEAENTTASAQTGTGTYNISAGTLATNVAGVYSTYYSAITGLTVANAGTGTLRVIGDDATISVTGNMLVNALPAADSTPARTGTLAFQLEAGDASLSTINVAPIPDTTGTGTIAGTGTATFAAGSVLQLDFNSVAPVQGVFTAVNAADIVNNGLIPSIPAGWNFKITPGGNGKLLKFFAGDLNNDGLLNADDYALMDRNAAKHLTSGADGDLNADGSIDSADYLLIDQAFALTQAQGFSPEFLAHRQSQFGADYVSSLLSSVPEPSLLVPLVACVPLLPQRHRRHLRA